MLRNGQKLTSNNGRFTLHMKTDGNLVVYSGGTPIWASRTNNKGCQPFRLVMQGDNNLCVYDGTGICTWASQTLGCGRPGAWVTMQVWVTGQMLSWWYLVILIDIFPTNRMMAILSYMMEMERLGLSGAPEQMAGKKHPRLGKVKGINCKRDS